MQPGGAIDRRGVEWAADQPEQLMALTVGSRLGHYDVTALIGEGGMGQVYQATDTKLNRQCVQDGRPIGLATGGAPYSSPYEIRDGEQFLVSCRENPVGQLLVMLDWASRS